MRTLFHNLNLKVVRIIRKKHNHTNSLENENVLSRHLVHVYSIGTGRVKFVKYLVLCILGILCVMSKASNLIISKGYLSIEMVSRY